jgi:hypothetical protein
MPTYPYTLASAMYFQNGHYNAIDDRKFLGDFLYPGVYGAPAIYNQVTNPSFEVGLTDWIAVGGTNTQFAGNASIGSYSMRTVSAASGQGMDYRTVSVVNGRRYFARVFVTIPVAGNASLRISDGAGTQKAIASRTSTGTINLEFVADATATDWRIRLLTNSVISHDIYWDAVFIHEIPTTGITLPYADGDSPGFTWAGTADNSATLSGGAFSVGFTSLTAATMSAIVDAGTAYVPGGNIADQGLYRVRQDYPQTVLPNTNPAAYPRLDQIIVRVMDDSADASGFNQARIECVPGNPTPGATISNRLGAANLDSLTEKSKSYLHLADVLVPGTAPGGFALQDRRVYAGRPGSLVIRDDMVNLFNVTADDKTGPDFLCQIPFTMFDGSLMRFRFHSPSWWSSADGDVLSVALYEVPLVGSGIGGGGGGISPIAVLAATKSGNRTPLECTFYYAPPKGVFEYSIGAYCSAGDTGTVSGNSALEIERA